jgi:ATPase family protein associated with various cellular activities (AAA)/winged helix domain-containing protein
MAADFSGELRRLDLLLHREILRLRAGYQLSLDELRGVYISDEQVDALLAELRPPGTPDSIDELTRLAAELGAALAESSPLAPLARRFGLTPFERDAILVALAPELSLKYEALYGYLNNAAARRRATIDLVLRLCRREPGDRAQLAATSRLLRDGFLETADAASEHRPELARELLPAPALVAALLDLPPLDSRLTGAVEPSAERRAAQVELHDAVSAALAELAVSLAPLAERPHVVLVADAAQAPESAAYRLARHVGRGLLRVFGSAWPEEPWATSALALTAQLRGDAVFLDVEEWGPEGRRRLPPLLTALGRARVLVVMTAASSTDWRSLVRERPAVTLRLEEPDVPARRDLWTRVLPPDVPERAVSEVAEHFRLGPAQIDDAGRTLALSLGSDEDPRRRLFAAARGQSSGDLGHLAQLVPSRHAWNDLVLPAAVMRRLRDVSSAVAARAKVFGDWGFGRRGGSGLMVLFAGSSGTGKTMSASVIAREIGLELYRIELASVVSKYIGETEKNLHRIFEAARRANVMLFFDEADALLGRRSEVKDAHDRYANIEVAYLLQQMEEHDGVIILASNLAKNMDQAFARRMHYVVEFPRPDAPLREKLWQKILPPEVPLGSDVDFPFLARQFELAGGDIKTVALDAAFVAAGAGRPLGMNELIAAVARQMLKQGRPVSAADFKQYHRPPHGTGNGVT